MRRAWPAIHTGARPSLEGRHTVAICNRPGLACRPEGGGDTAKSFEKAVPKPRGT